MQGNSILPVITGTKSKEGSSATIKTGEFPEKSLQLSCKRYAYGITYKGGSTNREFVGSSSITIERKYPEIRSESEVSEFNTEDVETEEADYIREENTDEEDVLEHTDNPSEEDILE